jgi:hypothetical protein
MNFQTETKYFYNLHYIGYFYFKNINLLFLTYKEQIEFVILYLFQG